MKEFLDLPAEVICIIGSFSDIKTVNTLRLVCLANHHLYDKVYTDLTTDVKKRAILKITEKKCEKLDISEHFNYMINSEFEIGIEIPSDDICFSSQEDLYSLLINLVENPGARVTQLTEKPADSDYRKNDYIIQDMLPYFSHLHKLYLYLRRGTKIADEVFTSVKENVKLNTLLLTNITSGGNISFNQADLPNLKDVTLIKCSGDSVVSLLSAAAPNLTKLNIRLMYCQVLADLQFSNLTDLELFRVDMFTTASILPRAPKLEKLSLGYITVVSKYEDLHNLTSLKDLSLNNCRGNISSVINQASQSLTKLEIRGVKFEDKTSAEFPNLQTLSMAWCDGDISSLLTQAAPALTNLKLSFIDMKTEIKKALTSVKNVNIDGQEIDIKNFPQVFTATGKLLDIFNNSRKRKHN